jgi:hypothetical protein
MTMDPTLDLLGSVIAALLTIMVLSYLIQDNVLFRIATYLFVGVASGYAGVIAWYNVIRPALFDPLLAGGLASLRDPAAIGTLILPWVLTAMLMFNLSRSSMRVGSLPMALLVGVGAAVVVGGGITGSLIPQSLAAAGGLSSDMLFPGGEPFLDWFERAFSAAVMLLATLSTLIYFRFSARREVTGVASRTRFTAVLAYIGQVFIALTFGVMYAGALSATLVVLAQRMHFLRDVFTSLIGGAP